MPTKISAMATSVSTSITRAPFRAQLDYACLNDLPDLHKPTSEMLSSWLWARIKPSLPELSWITVYEAGSCGANFDGSRYRIWKEMTLHSSLQLKHAPDGSLPFVGKLDDKRAGVSVPYLTCCFSNRSQSVIDP